MYFPSNMHLFIRDILVWERRVVCLFVFFFNIPLICPFNFVTELKAFLGSHSWFRISQVFMLWYPTGYWNNPLPNVFALKMMVEMKSHSSGLEAWTGAATWIALSQGWCVWPNQKQRKSNLHQGKEMIIYRIILSQRHFTWYLLQPNKYSVIIPIICRCRSRSEALFHCALKPSRLWIKNSHQTII